ncbi:hypothetical protein AC578_1376 [Pseudocercospora eumusae]|uniref:Thioesterase domain-containing protein n=1 Tax=Pseudocercospora eumusae TaxID=321146 RepID=A0A139HUW1_9PEZI|nr:hypothetical protein AC578_1376 [Pseudocercospora eumusae]
MSILRPLVLRSLRPIPRLIYRGLRRSESTAAQPTVRVTVSKTSPNATPRSRIRYLWLSAPLLAGLLAGGALANFFSPASRMPQAGTDQDCALMADLNQRIEEEFRVKVLRGKCLAVPKMLRGEEGGWVEIMPAVSAGPDRSEMLPFHDRLTDALQGAKGLGVERQFWDRGDKKLVAIVWLGGALSGWPGVTHGGLLATLLNEKIALAASLDRHGMDKNFNAAVKPQRLPGAGNHATIPAPTAVPQEPAQLSVDYVKPTYADNFHVVRVQPAWATEDNVRFGITNHEYFATLETMDGKVCVKATAKFDPRSKLERVEETVKETVGWTYKDFKNWMWPSRQEQSQIG